MRVKVNVARGRKFVPGRWYSAEWHDEANGEIEVRNGKHAAVWPLDQVEVRGVPDDHWEIKSASRVEQQLEGQAMEYPGRMAECPEGHVRRIPSRFDQPAVDLRCADCSRSYRLADTGSTR